MENNVNTLPSKENNRISINWMIFNPKEKEIDAKKLKIGKGAYIPKIENVEKTYIIENFFFLYITHFLLICRKYSILLQYFISTDKTRFFYNPCSPAR